MSILNHAPKGVTLRDIQVEALLKIEAAYKTSEVIAVRLSPGSGKSIIALTLANWRKSLGEKTRYIIPNNALVAQLKATHPDVAVLEKQAAYYCDDFARSCNDTKIKCKRFCGDCPFVAAKKYAKEASVVAMNPWVYYTHGLYAKNVIFDEAHSLIEQLGEMGHVKLWQREFKFPNSFLAVSDVVAWLQQEMRRNPDKRLANALRDVIRIKGEATIEYNYGIHRGREDKLLHIKPAGVRDVVCDFFWPLKTVRKLILLSATINQLDLDDLGLSNRRVAFIDSDSPIPAAQRPIIYEPKYSLAYRHRDAAIPYLAKTAEEMLARYPEKGLIHLTYAVASKLRERLTDPRLIFHDKNTKASELARFKSLPASSGAVLIGSGVWDGIDLPYDDCRWNWVAQIPWPSLAAPDIKKRAEQSETWYDWQVWKRIIQALGRGTRAIDDRCVNLLSDVTFNRLLLNDTKREPKDRMFPQYLRDALKIISVK
jgi:Rad3-related DNA helicase